MIKIALLLSLVTLLHAVPPHILFIVADDWGWYDVGYHQSDLKTPNIDALAEQGIKLENYYVQPVCTPSRSALMTGRYPLRYGRQHTPIQAAQPTGLFLNETIFPQILKKHGYATHAIGKWHLGIFQWPYTPLYRGFDTHYGYLLGEETYFTHIRNEGGFTGYDFRDQKNVLRNVSGQYSSHLFAAEAARIAKQHDPTKPLFLYVAMQTCHVPLQAPPEYIQRCAYIKEGDRRTYCAMTLTLDEAVKNITDAFIENGLWNNTLLVFTTDNGGLPQGSGYNWPLRGGKGTLWEGGVRGVAFTHGQILKRPGTKNNKLMHMVDWFPTLLDAAGIEYQSAADFPLDGVSAWEALNSVSPNPRSEVVLNIDPASKNSAVRSGDWKLIQGPQAYSGWYLPGNKTESLRVDDDIWLFNISSDPNEKTNLAEQNPKIVQQLQAIVAKYSKVMIAPWNPPDDPQANPQLHNGTWTPWR